MLVQCSQRIPSTYLLFQRKIYFTPNSTPNRPLLLLLIIVLGAPHQIFIWLQHSNIIRSTLNYKYTNSHCRLCVAICHALSTVIIITIATDTQSWEKRNTHFNITSATERKRHSQVFICIYYSINPKRWMRDERNSRRGGGLRRTVRYVDGSEWGMPPALEDEQNMLRSYHFDIVPFVTSRLYLLFANGNCE